MQMDPNNNTIHVITSFFYPQIPTKLWNLLSDHCNVIKILATTGLPTAVAQYTFTYLVRLRSKRFCAVSEQITGNESQRPREKWRK